MTLQAFLSSCSTAKMAVTISDSKGEIITFNSEGFAGVENDVLAREVVTWGVTTQIILNITIADVEKEAGSITLSANTASLTSVGDEAEITVTAATGAVSAESSDDEVATVEVDTTGANPVITIAEVAAGTATVTVTSAETETHTSATATIEVTCTAE